ncbi:nuclear transport factor 2 family protein [Algoriphagus sp. AGSA1]|uniref:nuclear transport factor 2 family protein n=1 Tax=Algoriphagus sp. AGSA1 TaxID=2907213 RepID=UPI001F1836E3|nr:nuclear transport factor 2 family protein [Algoriphagus sp. AGSA1]MCE7054981.1 nuclear transport factor 2 family protein [Algoriphagus sp. AGSA1]
MKIKEIAEKYFKAMVAGKFDEMGKLKTPDCVYWLSGEGSWPFGGYQSLENQGKLWGTVAERFPEGMKMTLQSITADDERAVLYVHIRGTRKDGRIYENNVLLLLTFKDGLISGLYEYLDTIMVNELFCGLMDVVK